MTRVPLLLLLLSLSAVAAAALPSQTVAEAARVLSNSGSVSMALTLELVADTLASQSPSATVFSPSDAAFADSGQPSLSLLKLHFSPLALSSPSLRSLPLGTKIPTMSPGKSLTVTSLNTSTPFSLNNVTVSSSPIYDDGSLIIYETDKFFDPNFTLSSPPQLSVLDPHCSPPSNNSSFNDAIDILNSRGYSLTATCLALQLLGFHNRTKLTVFAPVDDVTSIGEIGMVFRRHVVPCIVKFADLTNLEQGTVLDTYEEGHGVKVTRVDDAVTVNDIPVTFPDMYYSDWLVVHGLHEVFEAAADEVAVEGWEEPPPPMPLNRQMLEQMVVFLLMLLVMVPEMKKGLVAIYLLMMRRRR